MQIGDMFRVNYETHVWAVDCTIGDKSVATFNSGIGIYLGKHRSMSKVLVNGLVCVIYASDMLPLDFPLIKRLGTKSSHMDYINEDR